ncbi:MAG TPA: DUF2889 domain-containing protein, partial [Dongiaceae bacterium]|nr:DUF2889 domain-containing protein [Dongiaceae bacterium]
YAIHEARLTPLAGDVAPSVVAGFARLAGAALVGGLTRQVAALVGEGAGAALAVDATIEIGRLARQVAKMPRAEAERAASGDPLECWRLDTTGWIELPNSCFAYSEAGRRLLDTRTVAAQMTPDLYSPRSGQRKVFERRKVARLERVDDRLRLFHSMHDNVHGFEITYEIELTTGKIVRAEHITPRLPYMGICSEPQRRIASVMGETADAGLRKRIQTMLGGEGGCGQLYDLTSDLLKLLA